MKGRYVALVVLAAVTTLSSVGGGPRSSETAG